MSEIFFLQLTSDIKNWRGLYIYIIAANANYPANIHYCGSINILNLASIIANLIKITVSRMCKFVCYDSYCIQYNLLLKIALHRTFHFKTLLLYKYKRSLSNLLSFCMCVGVVVFFIFLNFFFKYFVIIFVCPKGPRIIFSYLSRD